SSSGRLSILAGAPSMLLVPASTNTFKGRSLSPAVADVPTTRISNRVGARTLLMGIEPRVADRRGNRGQATRGERNRSSRMLESTLPAREGPVRKQDGQHPNMGVGFNAEATIETSDLRPRPIRMEMERSVGPPQSGPIRFVKSGTCEQTAYDYG